MKLDDLLCETTRVYANDDPEVMCQWGARLYLHPDLDDYESSFGPQVGWVTMYTFFDLDFRVADDESGDLAPILEDLEKAVDAGDLDYVDLVPLLVVDHVFVEPEHRGKGYAALVEEKALQSLRGLHACVASFVSEDPEYRAQALHMADRLGFESVPGSENVRIRDLAEDWQFDVMPGS